MRRGACFPAVVLTMLFVCAQAAQGQSVEDVVAKNLQAKGGAETLKALQTARITGRMASQGVEAPMTTISKRPNKLRRETEMQGQKVVVAYDGTTVWAIMPGGPARELTGPPADLTREGAEFDSVLLDYREKGHSVELVGTETETGTKLHHLKVTRKSGQVQHFYIDAETGLDAKMVMTVEQGANKTEVVTEFSNYQKVDGLLVPFSIRQTANGALVAQLTIDKVEFNVPIDDALFSMPK